MDKYKADLKCYFDGKIGQTYKYSDAFLYANGAYAVAITPYEFRPCDQSRVAEVRVFITFSNGRKGDYTFGAENLRLWFEDAKPERIN